MVKYLNNNIEDTMLKAWSYSRLQVFEQCKYRAKLAFVDKIPEPERPLPPGKTEHANDRGHRVHLGAELYVQGKGSLIEELSSWEQELRAVKKYYDEGKVSIESDWGYDKEWIPTSWKSSDAWLRVKLDCMVKLGEDEALVVDYKTGRKTGNEIKHAEQGQLYQLATFLRYPELEKVHVEFWYLDQDDITQVTYNKEQGLNLFRRFNERGLAMTSCEEFKPNPNKFTCRYCPYGPKGTGHCEVGIQ